MPASFASRRLFLKTIPAAPMALPGLLSGQSPNGKLNHAVVGCDGQGWSDLSNIASHPNVHVAAICDVDTARMGKAAAKFPQARKYQDWREMLDKEGEKIDSVQVAIPDHMHAPVAIAAMEGGKHVYCEKPLAHAVAEARAMAIAAEKAGVVTQMGNQIQSSIEYRSAVILIQQGVIGKIKQVHAWSGASFPRQGRPAGADPVPATLDWDKWLGVAPQRPFKNGIYHPFNWRAWQDFGTGPIGDFMCHIMDTPFKALELTAPTTIRAASVPEDWAAKPEWNSENWPAWATYEYLFPGNRWTAGKNLPVYWYDGGKKPARELAGFADKNRNLPGGGSLFIGEGGNLLLPHVGGPQLIPYSRNKGLKRPKLEGRSHYHSFVDACLGKGKTTSHFGFAAPLAEATLLGNIANRFHGQQLQWNAKQLSITNHAAANKMVSKAHRKFS
ncbi:MAG: Gfo/Idh/MocA family oxidoreductase [Verrucomicrobiales bacterium]|nr:Gfo/Idh/MocA family oxidoreductase [Verrucomicrobiales bacterium]MED5586709.1 Gfo/Idh/MocA family oxidoreductase [Verrucomicrobiota bacterium]